MGNVSNLFLGWRSTRGKGLSSPAYFVKTSKKEKRPGKRKEGSTSMRNAMPCKPWHAAEGGGRSGIVSKNRRGRDNDLGA